MNIWLIIAIYLVSGVVVATIANQIINGMEKSAVYKYNAYHGDLLICVKNKQTAIALVILVMAFWPIGIPTTVAVIAAKYNKIRKGI